MGPGQLCPQCVHNLVVGKELGKAEHVVEVAPVESAPVLGAQLGGHRRDDLFAVLGPQFTKPLSKSDCVVFALATPGSLRRPMHKLTKQSGRAEPTKRSSSSIDPRCHEHQVN